jgi:hypothetical protein
MTSFITSIVTRAAAACLTAGALVAAPASASTYTVLKQGFNHTTGTNPKGTLFLDTSGALYADMLFGSEIIKLSPPTRGETNWKLQVIYSSTGPTDEQEPLGLIGDAGGNLYGTSFLGGNGDTGCIFMLSPPPSGQTAWSEQVIWNNPAGNDAPASLLIDGKGELTFTVNNSQQQIGEVIRLTPPNVTGGAWTPSTLVTFAGGGNEVALSGLQPGPKGDLYLLDANGGSSGFGSISQLAPSTEGQPWKVVRSASFTNGSADGRSPGGPVATKSTLYIAAVSATGAPTIVRAKPTRTGFALTTIYTFSGSGNEADSLFANPAGGLVGTSVLGGANGDGAVFTLTPPNTKSGAWNFTDIHDFAESDGENPDSIGVDVSGTIYGATQYGGPGHDGVIYSLTP